MPGTVFDAEKMDPAEFGCVAVLMGGRSAEREISLVSGAAVLQGLLDAGVDAFALDVFGGQGREHILEQLQCQRIDTVFNMLHGGEGEDGTLAGVLKILEISSTGSGMAASALAMNKVHCKLVWQGAGLPTAPFRVLTASSDWKTVTQELGLPLMVKPGREGSSIGMTKVEYAEDLQAAYELAEKFDSLVIAEKWLRGREFTVATLMRQMLPVIRLETEREFYDYQAKYIDDDTRYLIPSGLSVEKERQIQEISLQAFEIIGCSGWGRVDLMEDEAGGFQLLEVNTVPGMTGHSLVPMAAKAAGLDFSSLTLQILSTARIPGDE